MDDGPDDPGETDVGPADRGAVDAPGDGRVAGDSGRTADEGGRGDGGSDAASGSGAASGEEFHTDPAALSDREGWHVEGYAARVHYRGADDRYSVEYYGPSDCVLYWKVKGDGETAVPVGRTTVPAPLRERIREDLAAAGIDPAAEQRSL